jgi:hypothetical protein
MSGTSGAGSGTATIEPECYRLPEAGKKLGGVSRRLISNLIRDGHLEVTFVGSIRMVTADSIRRYVERNTTRSAK